GKEPSVLQDVFLRGNSSLTPRRFRCNHGLNSVELAGAPAFLRLAALQGLSLWDWGHLPFFRGKARPHASRFQPKLLRIMCRRPSGPRICWTRAHRLVSLTLSNA